eukprot:CAMPEP_0113472496 /NCGR_PEP_ID=MMETSP0014_2-20120614/17545_1 /TAXON_ID=2857 /ORGANISM="Nitzschia sp." /LENGTH=320 /DNA_ID=CAMNT_0000365207 /DNA_START=866 /DNA_END=1825 /DNA_ORIENTATION=- /assembly_acc=CAM_ASM_000159
MNRENENSSSTTSSSKKVSSVWWSPKLDEEIPYTLSEGHRERIQRRVNELGKLIKELQLDQRPRHHNHRHRNRHRIAWGKPLVHEERQRGSDVDSEKCYYGDSESTDSDSDSDSEESTVDSLILTRERFVKNAAEKTGVVLPAGRNQRRRQYRRERRKMWRDAAALHIRPLQQEQEEIKKDDGKNGEGEGEGGPSLKRRSLFRRAAVHRDSMSLTRERLPDLVHDFAKQTTEDDDDDDTSTTSESTEIDSLVLARARHIPRLITARESSAGSPAQTSSSASATAKPLQYRVQKLGTDRNGKVVWDLPEDISKSEHQRLEE